jgi:hypothetical protein
VINLALDPGLAIQPQLRDEIALRDKAMAGDMVMSIVPTTVAPAPTSSAWTRNVIIEIQTAAGEVHTWLDQAYTTTLSIADTSTAGTASIVSTTLTLDKGRAVVVVSGDEQDWLDTETDTLTVANIDIMGYTVTGGTSVETFTAP